MLGVVPLEDRKLTYSGFQELLYGSVASQLIAESPKLRLEIRPSSPLSAVSGNALFEELERGDEALSIGLPTHLFAFVGPVREVLVAAFAVASLARGNFVFDPARTTLQPRHDMFGGGLDELAVDFSATPNATRTITFEDRLETFAAVGRR